MKDKARKEKPFEKKGKANRYEFTDEKEDRNPTKKLTLNNKGCM